MKNYTDLATETKPYPAPKPGDVLPNGATVMRVRKLENRPGVNDRYLVLAQWFQGTRIEYVSWQYRCYADGAVVTYAGNYTRDLEHAIDVFKRRK